jgi:hypothetical protein
MLICKLKKRVQALGLNLKGKVVLTEAATGAYVVTPVLAALAGAKVFAFSKNTSYGTFNEVVEKTKEVYKNGNSLDITFIDSLTPEIIAKADIITNSGHLRPLDKQMLRHAKDTVVIPLMYEAWEWREADMDINYIRQRGFKVGATNERHPEVDVFNFLGDMAVKQIFDAGLCLYKNRFVLVCNNDFGPHIARAVSSMCDGLAVIDLESNKHRYQLDKVRWIGGFPALNIPEDYRDAEAIIFTAYPFDKSWIGEAGEQITTREIKEHFSDPYILRYAGDVDNLALDAAAIRYFPRSVSSGHMGILPSAIGYDPVIRLQAGGLKAGEALTSGNYFHQNIPILELI